MDRRNFTTGEEGCFERGPHTVLNACSQHHYSSSLFISSSSCSWQLHHFSPAFFDYFTVSVLHSYFSVHPIPLLALSLFVFSFHKFHFLCIHQEYCEKYYHMWQWNLGFMMRGPKALWKAKYEYLLYCALLHSRTGKDITWKKNIYGYD